MKKILSLLTIYFLLIQSSAIAQIIEFGKCYKVDKYNKEMVRSTWNIQDYKKLSVVYDKIYDEPKVDNNGIWDLFDREPFVTDEEEIKYLLKDGYKALKLYDKFILSINLSNETITWLRVDSTDLIDNHDKYVRRLFDLKKNFPEKWNKKNQEELDFHYNINKIDTIIRKYKIVEYVGGIFIGKRLEDLAYSNGEAIKFDINTGSYKISSFDKVNQNNLSDFHYKCTKDYKNITLDINNNKNSNSGIKKLLKKLY